MSAFFLYLDFKAKTVVSKPQKRVISVGKNFIIRGLSEETFRGD